MIKERVRGLIVRVQIRFPLAADEPAAVRSLPNVKRLPYHTSRSISPMRSPHKPSFPVTSERDRVCRGASMDTILAKGSSGVPAAREYCISEINFGWDMFFAAWA